MDLQWVSTVIPLPQLSWVIPFFSWEKSPSQPVGFETGRLLYPLTLRISSPAYGYSAPWPSRYSTIGIARCFHRIHAWEIDYPALCLQDSIFWKRKWFAGEKKDLLHIAICGLYEKSVNSIWSILKIKMHLESEKSLILGLFTMRMPVLKILPNRGLMKWSSCSGATCIE